jgi:hypothetical protein
VADVAAAREVGELEGRTENDDAESVEVEAAEEED